MSKLFGKKEYRLLCNSASLIRSALRLERVVQSILLPLHPDEIHKIIKRMEEVHTVVSPKRDDVFSNDQAQLMQLGVAGDSVEEIATIDFLERSANYIRAALSRKEILEIILSDVLPDDFENMLLNLNHALEAQQKRLSFASSIAPPMQECIDITLEALAERGLSFDSLQKAITKSYQNAKPIAFIKEGVEWGGVGRRPTVFSGLSIIEIEKYRVDTIELQRLT